MFDGRITFLYRGPLSSCNYDCHYCPFGKTHNTREELEYDRDCLRKFVSWCQKNTRLRLRVFFTPWGEALTRRWYWEAFRDLTACEHIDKVAIQTNLSANLNWLETCERSKIGIWATFHPSQAILDRFLAQVDQLRDFGVSHSVGMVGLREDFDVIEEMRERLPVDTYLWINAFKSQPNYYQPGEVERLCRIDPWFHLNTVRHPSHGKMCNTGYSVLSVDGEGNLQRCHFVKNRLGNLYQQNIEELLKPRTCPNSTCGCYIGYAHLQHLQLESVYGEGLLERTPITQAPVPLSVSFE